MKLSLEKLAERLEEEIHVRMTYLQQLDADYRDMEYKVAPQEQLDKQMLEMAKVVHELYPVTNIILSQNPDLREMFDYLLDLYDKKIAPKQKKKEVIYDNTIH